MVYLAKFKTSNKMIYMIIFVPAVTNSYPDHSWPTCISWCSRHASVVEPDGHKSPTVMPRYTTDLAWSLPSATSRARGLLFWYHQFLPKPLSAHHRISMHVEDVQTLHHVEKIYNMVADIWTITPTYATLRPSFTNCHERRHNQDTKVWNTLHLPIDTM